MIPATFNDVTETVNDKNSRLIHSVFKRDRCWLDIKISWFERWAVLARDQPAALTLSCFLCTYRQCNRLFEDEG